MTGTRAPKSNDTQLPRPLSLHLVLRLPSMRLLSKLPSLPLLSKIRIGYPSSVCPGEPVSPVPGVPGGVVPGGVAVGLGLICATCPPVH